jgi:alcohol dehydrogenase class IV
VLDQLESLRTRLRLPATLTQAGAPAIDVGRVAAAVLEDPTTRSSPGAPFTQAEVQALLAGVRRHPVETTG